MRCKPLIRNLKVRDKVIRGTAPAVLRAEPADLVVAVYDPFKKIGYMGNFLSEFCMPKESRARSTCEPVLQRVRKDKTSPQDLYAILAGDSICSVEYDGPLDDGNEYYASQESAVANHTKYRNEIVQHLVSCGFQSEKIFPYFTKNIDYEQNMFLDAESGDVEIREYNPEYRTLYQWIIIHDLFKNIKIHDHQK